MWSKLQITSSWFIARSATAKPVPLGINVPSEKVKSFTANRITPTREPLA